MRSLTILFLSCLYITTTSSLKVVVSGYNSRLATYEVSGDALTPSGEWDVGEDNHDMTWLQVDGGNIWAGHEVADHAGEDGSVVSRWEVSSDGLVLEPMEFVNTGSVYTAHLLVDKDQNMAYAANYGGSSFTAITLQDGKLGELAYLESFGEGCRDASHPHQTVTYKEWVWVVDLGCDMIWHYRVEQQQLEKVGQTPVTDGGGPRHMVKHPNRDLVFLLYELQSRVEVYRLMENTGELVMLQELQLSHDDEDFGAEILVGPTGKYVYASSRGSGVVVTYKLEDDDTLVRLGQFRLSGTWPRSMAIRDNLMVVIDQHGDQLQLLTIDPETGKLQNGHVAKTPSQPSFVDFMD